MIRIKTVRRAAGPETHSWFRRFPPLSEARRLFREKHPWWSEFDNMQQDWQLAPEHDGVGFNIGQVDQEEEPLEGGLSGHKGYQFG